MDGWDRMGGGRMKSDEEWAAELTARGIPPEQIAAYQANQARYVREGGELPGQPPWMAGPQPVRIRTDDLTTGDMHNPGWGIERPGDAAGPIAPLPPAQSGTFPTHDAAGRAPGDPQWGMLGGMSGMGQPSIGQQIMAGRGGGNAFGGAISGLFGGGGRAANTLTGGLMGGYGQPAAASVSGYGGGRQSPTPYGMGRSSPTPYQGSGYSTLGGMSGYGRRY